MVVCSGLGACSLLFSSDSDGEGDSPPIPENCGDGLLDPDEECDDGNEKDDDACRVNCKLASCGDGVVRPLIEECDDGNDDDADGCTNLCSECTPESASGVMARAGSCYSWHNASGQWSAAGDACAALGRHLVVYSDSTEMNEVSAGLAVQGTVWIGLYHFGSWTWVTGEPFGFSNWSDGTTPEVTGMTGAAQDGDGDWTVPSDGQASGFICESQPRPPVWDDNRHYYWRTESMQAWADADATCGLLGGHLATFAGAEEKAYALSTIAACGKSDDPCWIGASDHEQEGEFRWVTGELVGEEGWAPGSPTEGADHHCVKVAPTTGQRTNTPCSEVTHGICELE